MNDDNQTGRQVDQLLASLVRKLAEENPGKSVALTVAHAMHHAGPSVCMKWSMQVGFSPYVRADGYEEVIAQFKHEQTPDFRRAAAARLRREADELEAAANLQSSNPTSTPPPNG